MTGGVVRRDGLREAVGAIHKRDGTDTGYCVGDGFVWPCPTARALDAVPDVPPTGDAGDESTLSPLDGCHASTAPRDDSFSPGYPASVTDQCTPVVPPDPPAGDRDELARTLAVHRPFTITGIGIRCGCGDQNEYTAHLADALLSSGVLVAAADVRARALEDAAARIPLGVHPLLDGVAQQLCDRAVSEREGTT